MKFTNDIDIDALTEEMMKIGHKAQVSARILSATKTAKKKIAIEAAARFIAKNQKHILEANHKDMRKAQEIGINSAMQDRLALDTDRIGGMILALREIAELTDPIGKVLAEWTRPNGLRIERVSVPLGVLGIIYEARPNVTSDAGAVGLMAGNATILRCGSESFYSSQAIAFCLQSGLKEAGLPEDCIQMVSTTDRAAVGILLKMDEAVDIIIPRGGRALVERVKEESQIPVMAHLDGICHVYVHENADINKAIDICFNAKMRRPGICGATETLLIDRGAVLMVPKILEPLFESGCEVRGDTEVCALDPRVVKAHSEDWDTEYLDAIISVRIVDDVNQAILHINKHGSQHTDSIITEDNATADRFLSEIDSAIVMHNTSTQFADGNEFGMGAEIGISNGKLHARGPVGAEQLTTYKYRVYGTGQVRS